MLEKLKANCMFEILLRRKDIRKAYFSKKLGTSINKPYRQMRVFDKKRLQATLLLYFLYYIITLKDMRWDIYQLTVMLYKFNSQGRYCR